MYFDAATKKVHGLNGSGRSSSKLSLDYIRGLGISENQVCTSHACVLLCFMEASPPCFPSSSLSSFAVFCFFFCFLFFSFSLCHCCVCCCFFLPFNGTTSCPPTMRFVSLFLVLLLDGLTLLSDLAPWISRMSCSRPSTSPSKVQPH